MMDSTYVNAIADLGAKAEDVTGKTLEHAGRLYSTTPLHLVKRPTLAEPAVLTVNTLSGLAAYVEANRDELELGECLVHVEGPGVVSLRSKLEGEHRQRFAFVTAENLNRFAAVPLFAFGRYLSLADTLVALLSLFEDTLTRADLLKVLGTVKVEEGVTQEDDGVKQSVTAKRGIRLVESLSVPSPIVLRPFRTFPELAQPESPFVVRLQERGAGVDVALFEADGGAWKLEAIRGAAEWLRGALPAELAVIA